MISPSRTITIGGKDYVLDGSFGTLRAVQEFFGRDIVRILVGILDMRVDEIAALIAIGSGQRSEANVIGQAIVDTMDMMDFQLSADYYLLKSELLAWLNVAIAPKDAREKKRAEMDAEIAKQSGSLGKTTSDSLSESSAGSPASSGVATSGN